MDYDRDKVEEMVLALLWLTLGGDGRAWKGHDWEAMERLHERGYISDPKSKAKSVVLSEEGERWMHRGGSGIAEFHTWLRRRHGRHTPPSI